MKSMHPRHASPLVGAVALLGACAALAGTSSVDSTMTMTAVTSDTQLTEAPDTNSLHEQPLNNVDDGATADRDEAQQGQHEIGSTTQDAAETSLDNMQGHSDSGVSSGVNDADGI